MEPRFFECGHSFCSECIKESLNYKKQCPLCRTNTTISANAMGCNDKWNTMSERVADFNINLMKNYLKRKLDESNDLLGFFRIIHRISRKRIKELNRELKEKQKEQKRNISILSKLFTSHLNLEYKKKISAKKKKTKQTKGIDISKSEKENLKKLAWISIEKRKEMKVILDCEKLKKCLFEINLNKK